MPPLLEPWAFNHVFLPYAGCTAGYVTVDGNVGDVLIHLATEQLVKHFGIRLEYTPFSSDINVIFVCGGGNSGDQTPWQATRVIKRAVLDAATKPVVLLPQSFNGSDSDAHRYSRVFVRENLSLRCCDTAILAPDPALGYVPPRDWTPPPPTAAQYLALRANEEGFWRERGVNDPTTDEIRVSSPRETWQAGVLSYLAKAARAEHVITDRLHFAIAGLIVGRKVTLLPNRYHKNYGMWQSWLRHFGCLWSDGSDFGLPRVAPPV